MLKRILVAATLTLAVALPASGQPQDSSESCVPASERAGRTYGCFIVASQDVGRLGPAAVFWQLETFPTAAAAAKARSARGSVLEAFGKVWLLTIGGSGWRSPGGTHVAEIGPLPIAAGTPYTAQYMEAVFKPGMKSRVHRHSGPEAWLTLSGETCLETPEGTLLGRTGGSHVVVPSGPPMELTATGSEVRRALVLVLHDSSQPPTSPAPDWSPKGLCKVSAPGNSVLFLGNSFTFGYGSPVRFYRSNTVTDLNGEGIGGVPALFKSFTAQAGIDYDVSLETRGGAGLEFHLENKQEALASRAWDKVVMQGQSMLDLAKPGDATKLIVTSRQLADFLRTRNPSTELYLMATWSRADQTYPQKGAWFGKPIETMARDVRAGNDKAAAGAAIKKVIPVGEAWNRAMQAGIADPNPYDGIEAGKLDLWTYDHYHASTAGYYLEALVVFGSLTGRDPRSLGDGECSAFELGLDRPQVKALQQVAFDELSAAGIVTAAAPAPAQAVLARCGAGR